MQFWEATFVMHNSSHHEHRASASSSSSAHKPGKHSGHHHHSLGPPPGADPQVWHSFAAVDADRSGYITADELQTALVNGMLFHHDLTRYLYWYQVGNGTSKNSYFLWRTRRNGVVGTGFDLDTVKLLMNIFVRLISCHGTLLGLKSCIRNNRTQIAMAPLDFKVFYPFSSWFDVIHDQSRIYRIMEVYCWLAECLPSFRPRSVGDDWWEGVGWGSSELRIQFLSITPDSDWTQIWWVDSDLRRTIREVWRRKQPPDRLRKQDHLRRLHLIDL